MQGMLSFPLAVLLQFQLFLGILPVFLGRIIAALAFGTLERDQFDGTFLGSHNFTLSFRQEMEQRGSNAQRAYPAANT
jgi:hypothetical protein